jgi:hypothetical protein
MNSINASTGFAPFQLLMGRLPRVIPPITSRPIEGDGGKAADAKKALQIIEQIETDTMEPQDNLLLAKLLQGTHANDHRGPKLTWDVGDKVLLSTLHR